MEKLQSNLNSLFTWIYRLMIANFLWLFFTLNGFILGGVFPSTSALFAVCRKWIKGEDVNIYNTFKNYYKKDQVPYPLHKIKKVVRKIEPDE